MNPDPKTAGWRKHALYLAVGIPLVAAWPLICVLGAVALVVFLAGTLCYCAGEAAVSLFRILTSDQVTDTLDKPL